MPLNNAKREPLVPQGSLVARLVTLITMCLSRQPESGYYLWVQYLSSLKFNLFSTKMKIKLKLLNPFRHSLFTFALFAINVDRKETIVILLNLQLSFIYEKR